MAVSGVGSQKTIEDILSKSSSTTKDRNTGELGKDDFLNLLITQLRYQDPLKPLEDKEFIAQMAQFTALEQTKNMNSLLTNSEAFSMIGKYINASTTDEKTGEISDIEGTVTSVKISDGKTYVVVNNKDVLLDTITNVSEDSISSGSKNLSEYTSLINGKVKAAVYDSKTGSIVPANGTVVSLEKGMYEDYAVLDGSELTISSVTKSDGSILETPEAIKTYLDGLKTASDKNVTVTAVNPSTGNKVNVTATFDSYTASESGVIKVKLNGVYVPVESITKIEKQ